MVSIIPCNGTAVHREVTTSDAYRSFGVCTVVLPVQISGNISPGNRYIPFCGIYARSGGVFCTDTTVNHTAGEVAGFPISLSWSPQVIIFGVQVTCVYHHRGAVAYHQMFALAHLKMVGVQIDVVAVQAEDGLSGNIPIRRKRDVIAQVILSLLIRQSAGIRPLRITRMVLVRVGVFRPVTAISGKGCGGKQRQQH